MPGCRDANVRITNVRRVLAWDAREPSRDHGTQTCRQGSTTAEPNTLASAAVVGGTARALSGDAIPIVLVRRF